MESNPRMMGVGCFARPQTLARVLRRAVEAYIMAPLESLDESADAALSAETGSLWLRHLVAGQPALREAGTGSCSAPPEISGFFLGFGRQGPWLSVFTGPGGSAGQRLTARLDEIAALRRRRLH